MSPELRKLSHLIKDIQGLENELHKYERQYRLRSEGFYRLAHHGKLEQSPDFLMWLGVCETLRARKREYRHLLKIEIAPIVTALNREAHNAQTIQVG